MLQADEEFFACKWTVDKETGRPLLLLAGKNSVLRVLDVMQEKLLWVRRWPPAVGLYAFLPALTAAALAPSLSQTLT